MSLMKYGLGGDNEMGTKWENYILEEVRKTCLKIN